MKVRTIPAILVVFTCLPPGFATTPAETVVATYRDGQITAAELEAWHGPDLGGADSTIDQTRRFAEDLMVARVLAARFGELKLGETDRYRSERSALEARLITETLEQQLRKEATPTEAEIRAEFKADPDAYRKPERWRISNIFKRFDNQGDEAHRAALRREMAAIRDRAVAGEDFAQLAADHSESSTRIRGGDAGFVTLDRLVPEVARAVSELGPGDLSPVLENDEGLTLIRCTAVLPAKSASFDEARPKIKKRLRARRAEAISADLASLEAEALRRGLTDRPDFQRRLRQSDLRLRAQMAANHLAEKWIIPVTPEEVAASYEQHRAALIEPRAWRLEVLETEIDRTRPRAYYTELRRRADRLSREGGTLTSVASNLEPKPEINTLGWLNDDQIWMLGRSSDAAIRQLEPDGVSSLVQDGRRLRIYHLIERRDRRPLSRERGMERIRQVLSAARRRAAGSRLRQTILEEQDLQVISSAESSESGQ